MARLTPAAKELLTQTMRKAIIDTSIAIITAEGSEKLTAAHLARQLGVCRGTLYNYFKDRDDLLQTLLSESVANFTKMLDEVAAEPLLIMEKLRRIVFFLLKDQSGQRRLYQAIKRHCLPEMEENFRRCHCEVITKIESIFVTGYEEGGLRPMDFMVAAAIFYGALWELCCRQNANVLTHSPEKLTDEFMMTLQFGLLAPAPQ